MKRIKEYDCQCGYCKDHICNLNLRENKCIDPKCKNNKEEDSKC